MLGLVLAATIIDGVLSLAAAFTLIYLAVLDADAESGTHVGSLVHTVLAVSLVTWLANFGWGVWVLVRVERVRRSLLTAKAGSQLAPVR